MPTLLPEPFADDEKKIINVVIETPRGCRNKFKYDDKLGLFRLNSVFPAGSAFPYDFGFISQTKAREGDPINVLLLMDQPAFAGCVIAARVIGVIEAEQKEIFATPGAEARPEPPGSILRQMICTVA